MREDWGNGEMECWRNGVMEWWSVGKTCQSPTQEVLTEFWGKKKCNDKLTKNYFSLTFQRPQDLETSTIGNRVN